MNETISRKRRLKFTIFFKKRNSKKNPKNKPNVTNNNNTTNSTLPIKVSYLRRQKKHIHSHNNNNSKKHIRYASPNRKTMPQEIRIHPVAPDSPLSLVSNLTGDPALKDPGFKPPQSFPMLSGGLTTSLDNDNDAASSFSMEDLHVSRQLFQSHHDDRTRDSIRNGNSFARLQLERAKIDQSSFLARSKHFHKLVDWAFDAVDVDQSGLVDKKELYSGLILIHLKLASYLGPAACRPASRTHVYEIFDLIDFDRSGKLNRVEFGTVMLLFSSQIITRVVLHMLMAIIIVPFLSKYIVVSLVRFHTFTTRVFSEVNEVKIVKEAIYQCAKNVFEFLLPDGILQFVLKSKMFVQQFLMDESRDTFIFTMIGVLLGMILLPWIFSQFDEIYESLAKQKRNMYRKGT